MIAQSLPNEERENAARLIWTLVIVGFFVLQGILWTVAITLTLRDPSHAILENYDERALHWDEYQSLQRASRALEWQATIEVGARGDLYSRHALTVRLCDRDGLPVSDAKLTVRLFHLARAGEAETFVLQESAPGNYSGTATMRAGGNWQFEITAVRGEDSFAETIRRDLSLVGARSQ